jgi:lipopolysaccharide heptosyltransferase I
MQRLLIIKLSSLGDVVHALPVASALRRRFPPLHLTWAVERQHAALVRHHPAIDDVVVLPPFAWSNAADRGWLAAVRHALQTVRAQRYDIVLDLQGLMKSSLVALASGTRFRMGVPPQREGARFVSRAVPLPHRELHAVDRYLAAAQFLGAPPEPVEFALPVQPEATVLITQRLATKGVATGARLIVINASTARREKTWPADQWAQVIDELAGDGTVVLIGTAADRQHLRAITRLAHRVPVDLVGETTLEELIALLERSTLHIAGDTGTLHIAAALGRPVVGIYGPTDPAQHGPYGQLDAALRRAERCGRTCPRICARRHACLRAITPEEVIARSRIQLVLP